MESYLEKKSSGLFKNYQRRWFVRQGNKIVYKENKDSEEFKLLSTMDNCTDVQLVSEDAENRSFDIAFKDRTYRLRAVSTSLCVAWVINLKVCTILVACNIHAPILRDCFIGLDETDAIRYYTIVNPRMEGAFDSH